jgi:hypothetical protein
LVTATGVSSGLYVPQFGGEPLVLRALQDMLVTAIGRACPVSLVPHIPHCEVWAISVYDFNIPFQDPPLTQ